MNSVPNSDRNSALSPKLGWVHQVHSLNPDCMHRPRALFPGSVIAPCRRPSTGRVAGLDGRVVHCIVAPPARAAARIAASCTVTWRFPGRVALVLRHKPAAKLPAYHDTPICIATQSPNNQALACAPLALERGPLMSQAMLAVSWRRLGRIVAESWSCRGPQVAPRPHLPSLVSRYNTLYRDSNGQ